MQPVSWADIGINLTDSSFDKDRHEVIEQAFEHGIELLVITGTNLAESEQAIELCQSYPGKLFCTVGIHPHYAKDHSPEQFDQLRSLYQEPGVVAVGETGLDFNRNFSTPEQQIKAFELQLESANATQLPLFLHERDAHQTQLQMLKSHRDDFSRAVAHCFTGTKEELYNYLDLDLYIGVTGWLCDERRGKTLQQLVKDIPADRLLLETDAPYLLPRDIRPKPKSRRNLPIYLPHIAQTLSGIIGKDPEQLQQEVWHNSRRFFAID